MADGLCSGDPVGDVIEKTLMKDRRQIGACEEDVGIGSGECNGVNGFYMASASEKLFDKVCCGGSASSGAAGSDDKQHHADADEGFMSCEQDDCRKKRCVDRYDSSESSDSGVAVLSCTDCSASSTASSDITDPGSPFSTASSHSDDSGSGSQPAKMPPTQTAHHQPWPWSAEDVPSMKRSLHQEQTTFPKRLKSTSEDNTKTTSKQSPPCLNNTSATQTMGVQCNNNNNNNKLGKGLHTYDVPSLKKSKQQQQKLETTKQGKITEYFKSQVKLHVIKKDAKDVTSSANANLVNKKYVSLVDQQTQFNGIRPSQRSTSRRTGEQVKSRKVSQVTVHRKILPAPSKMPEMTINHHHNMTGLTPTVTLTAVSFPPNLTYLHTKSPKPPDNIFNINMPQFTTITSDKINAIPLISRTPCLNVIHQPVQKITTINNFNCMKLNATVVPIVKLNTLPARLNGTAPGLANVALSVETAVPTVLSAKPKVDVVAVAANLNSPATTPKQHATPTPTPAGGPVVVDGASQAKCRNPPQQQEVHNRLQAPNGLTTCRIEEKAPSPDSDSGISYKDHLEVAVADETPLIAAVPSQKSPILSQPKTIRFPAKKRDIKDELKDTKTTHTSESGLCRWAECSAQFDTSGALLEHLQVKHVISQATQEHYVCLWLGCKVHGRTSCSRSWLERHVLAHAGTKPFRCIVDGCGQRFNSQLTLQRHVNGHFNGDGSPNNSTKKTPDNAVAKLFKRNGKKIRFRRQPWSARMFDFFDCGIMEGMQHKLLAMKQTSTLNQIGATGDNINVTSQVLAKRVDPQGKALFLVKWHPAGIMSDEWVTENEYVSTKCVPIPSLQPSAKDMLYSKLFPQGLRNRKRCRKQPISKQT